MHAAGSSAATRARLAKQRARAGLRDARKPYRRAPRGVRLDGPRSAWMHVPWWILSGIQAGEISQVRSDALGESLRSDQADIPTEHAYRSLPMGIVMWAPNPSMPSILRTRMVVCEGMSYQRFIEATDEDVRAEGWADRTAWRRGWTEARQAQHFDPMAVTEVFRVRELRAGDLDAIGAAMARRMFEGYEHGEGRDRHVAQS